MKPTDFSKALTDYLRIYLPEERGVSANTLKSYKDTFVLLLSFMQINNKRVDTLRLDDFTQEIIIKFLDWIENERKCGIATRNARLATIHSFFRYLQYRSPSLLNEWQRILSIPMKKTEKPIRDYICTEGIKCLLDQPNQSTSQGLRDLTILSLLYDSGARVQELIDLTPSDINFNQPFSLRIMGKGRKKRLVPLTTQQVAILSEYVKLNKLYNLEYSTLPLFRNNRNEKFSRVGINYILQKYLQSAKLERPDLFPTKISPHILRHSKAMHLLQAGVNIIYIRDFLGHSSITTTEVYARADSKFKRDALEKAHSMVPNVKSEQAIWLCNEGIMEWLKQIK